MDDRRRAPRVPILTQVEAQGEANTALGRARDISVGGLLVETPETFSEGASVIVRFFIPSQPRPIQAAGRVVRVAPGKSMGIAFLGLRQADQEKVIDFISQVEGVQPEELFVPEKTAGSQERRSARVPRRMSVILTWQDDEGRPQQESAETQLLSKHGAMLLSFSELEPGQILRIATPDRAQKGVSRVVYVKAAPVPGRVEVGLEVLGTENFWGLEFPAHDAGRPRRRRSGRILRRAPVVLCWTDEFGRARELAAETREWSPHGARIDSTTALPLDLRFRVRAPELGREAEAQVIHVQPGEVPGRTDLGIEFLNVENFWGVAFPPEQH